MPLIPRVFSQLLSSALGMLRHDHAKYDDTDGTLNLARDLFRKVGGLDAGYNFAQVWQVARQADAAYEAGLLLSSGQAVPTPPTSFGIPRDAAQYEYRTIYTYTDPAGRVLEQYVVVRSDRPLSYAEVADEARSMAENMAPTNSKYARVRKDGRTPGQDVIILTASGK